MIEVVFLHHWLVRIVMSSHEQSWYQPKKLVAGRGPGPFDQEKIGISIASNLLTN